MSDGSSQNSGGWGTQYSDNFKGIPHKRSCTDFYCLTILAFFVAFWLAIGYYAYWNGDINRLSALRDSHGRTCGIDEGVKDAKYLFFFDITQCVSLTVFLFGCSESKQICVPKCPTKNWFSGPAIDEIKREPFPNWSNIRERLICENESVAKSVNSVHALEKVIDDKLCAEYYVKSTSPSDFFRLCLPNPLGIRADDYIHEIIEKSDSAQKYFNDVYKISDSIRKDFLKSWHLIALFVGTAVVSCLFIILIMGVITKIFVWVVLWLILLLLLYSAVITYMQYDSMSPETTTSSPIPTGDNPILVSDYYPGTVYGQLCWLFHQKQTWLVLFAASAVLFVLFATLLIFLRSRIGVAVMLIGEGSKAMNTIKSTLCLPMVTRVLQLGVVVWFLLVFLYIKSLGDSVYRVQGLDDDADCHCRNYKENDWCLPRQFSESCTSRTRGGPCETATCVFVEMRSPQLKVYFQLYNFFGMLWGVFFVSGFNRMILSFCFATWYWTYNKVDVPFFTLTYSVYITVRYHMGTIAVGSFLIATCGFIRALLERAHKMVKHADGVIAECSMWSLRCCFWMLQKFLIFISNNAYVMCAIMGRGFFSSASEAFGLLTRNILRVVVLDKVLDFLMFVGKFVITFLLTGVSYYAFSSKSLDLSYPWVPTIFVGVVTWIISSSFFGVYSIAVDTLFLSFLKDGEMNDGSQNKPYYMSHRLKYILKEKLNRPNLH